MSTRKRWLIFLGGAGLIVFGTGVWQYQAHRWSTSTNQQRELASVVIPREPSSVPIEFRAIAVDLATAVDKDPVHLTSVTFDSPHHVLRLNVVDKSVGQDAVRAARTATGNNAGVEVTEVGASAAQLRALLATVRSQMAELPFEVSNAFVSPEFSSVVLSLPVINDEIRAFIYERFGPLVSVIERASSVKAQ